MILLCTRFRIGLRLLRLDCCDFGDAVADPTLPTVSLIAYNTKASDSPNFLSSVDSAVVGTADTIFWFCD